MDHQDWNVVTWRKTKSTSSSSRDTNRSYLQSKHNKLENEHESFRHREMSHEFRIALQKTRVSSGLSQKELANLCHINVSLVQSYETGKSVPTPQIRTKLNRVLKTTLPKK